MYIIKMCKNMSFLCILLLAILAIVNVASAIPDLTSLGVEVRDDNLPARVPYTFPPPGTDATADSMRSRRANHTLLDLDGALLDAPLVAKTWNDFFGIIRDNNTLPPDMREFFILRIATLTNSSYIWFQHESVGRSVGLTTPQLLVARLAPPFFHGMNFTSILGPALTAAMAYVDHITVNVHVPDSVFENLRNFLNTEQLVEATATTGGYAMVSRFVVGLNLDDKMGVPVPIPS